MKIGRFLLLLIPFLVGCKKEPGVGGNASITGSVWAKNYNASFTTLIGEYPAKDVYVYIVYGDNKGYDRRIKTDYNGNFNFPFLYKGKYTIYTYSLDSTLQDLSGSIPIVKEIEITQNKEEFVLEPLTIFE